MALLIPALSDTSLAESLRLSLASLICSPIMWSLSFVFGIMMTDFLPMISPPMSIIIYDFWVGVK